MPWPGVSVVQVHLLFQRDTSGQFQGYWYSLHSTNRFFGEEQIRGVDQWSNFAFLFLVTVESLSTLRRHLPLQRLLVPALADTIPSKWNWKLVVVNKMYTQLLWKVLLVEGKNPLTLKPLFLLNSSYIPEGETGTCNSCCTALLLITGFTPLNLRFSLWTEKELRDGSLRVLNGP